MTTRAAFDRGHAVSSGCVAKRQFAVGLRGKVRQRRARTPPSSRFRRRAAAPPCRHRGELDAVLDDLKQLARVPPRDSQRQLRRMRRHAHHQWRSRRQRTAMARPAPAFVVRRAAHDPRRLIERRRHDQARIGVDRSPLDQIEHPGSGAPMAGAGLDRNHAAHRTTSATSSSPAQPTSR